jgi:hypothetical protein
MIPIPDNNSVDANLINSRLILALVIDEYGYKESIFSNAPIMQTPIRNLGSTVQVDWCDIEFDTKNTTGEGLVFTVDGVNTENQTKHKAANLSIWSDVGSVIQSSVKIIIDNNWTVEGDRGLLIKNKVTSFINAMYTKSVMEGDEALLMGIDQATMIKNNSRLRMRGYKQIASSPIDVGLTPQITSANFQELVAVLSEIKNYYTQYNAKNLTISPSKMGNLIFIVGSTIMDSYYETFNSGTSVASTKFNVILREILGPEVTIIESGLLRNSMFVIDGEYVQHVLGKPLDIDIATTAHNIESILCSYTIGSVVCKNPSKVLYYQDFIMPATATQATRMMMPNTQSLEEQIKKLEAKNRDMEKLLKKLDEASKLANKT